MPREMKQVGLPWLKEIPASWHAAKLKFYTSVVNGFSVNDRDKDEYLKTGPNYIPYLMTMDLDKDSQSIKHKSKLFSSKDDNRFNIAPLGSVITLTMGNSGRRAVLVDREVTFGRAMIAIVPKREYLNSSFLHYLLTSNFYEYYVDLNQDTFVRYIRTTKILDFTFPLPPLEEQEKIGAFLDKHVKIITQLIVTEKKRVAKYKELIKVLHKKLIFKEDDELIDTVFNGNIRLAESKGYRLLKIKHIFKKIKEPVTVEDPIVICSVKGKTFLRGNKKYRSSLDPNKVTLFQKIKKGQLVINGFKLANGAIVISDHDGRCSSLNHCLELLDSKSFNLKYFYYFFRATAFLGLYAPFANTVFDSNAGFSGWNRTKELPILYPSLEEQERIANFLDYAVGEAEQEIADSLNLIDKLVNLRTSLISETLTGKIDVRHLDLATLTSADPHQFNQAEGKGASSASNSTSIALESADLRDLDDLEDIEDAESYLDSDLDSDSFDLQEEY